MNVLCLCFCYNVCVAIHDENFDLRKMVPAMLTHTLYHLFCHRPIIGVKIRRAWIVVGFVTIEDCGGIRCVWYFRTDPGWVRFELGAIPSECPKAQKAWVNMVYYKFEVRNMDVTSKNQKSTLIRPWFNSESDPLHCYGCRLASRLSSNIDIR